MHFTFKGEAKPLGPRWHEGWQDGYDHVVKNKPCPFEWWGSESGEYGNGYAEGLLSGSNEMMNRLCINHWPPHRNFELQ